MDHHDKSLIRRFLDCMLFYITLILGLELWRVHQHLPVGLVFLTINFMVFSITVSNIEVNRESPLVFYSLVSVSTLALRHAG